MKLLYCSFISCLVLFLISCDEEAQPDPKQVAYKSYFDSLLNLRKDPNFDFSKFAWWTERSEGAERFPAQITAIETKLRKGFFKKSPGDDYDKTRDGDGYDLVIRFSLTNPYSTTKKIAVSDYHWVGSKDFFTYYEKTTSHKDCQCRIDNGSETYESTGRKIKEIRDRCTGSDPCIEFQPGETKEFTVKFNHPFYETAKKIFFGGLNHYYTDGYNMTREIYFIIDVDQKKVIGDSLVEPG